ncbi:MAG: carboxylesterase family protein [Firmicutes bacterium]|nr:carboxylesterase family protein [Bacillota bacterium]
MKKRSAGWIVLLVVFALFFAAVLELGKHTLLGWILTAAAVAAFAWLRKSKLAGKKRGVRFLSWLALIAVFFVILAVSWPPVRPVPAVSVKNPEKTATVRVEQGELRGVYNAQKSVKVYAGIPYAKPPVGELRWKEPQPADAWEGVLEADHFAPMSMQTTNLPIYDSLAQIIGYHDYKISLTDNWRPPVSEDSLYLNIWTPSDAEEGSKLPVMVYIHGGSLQTGQPWYQDYSGEGLAKNGVIVVNMGYRLGVFGFFADEELAAESQNGTTGNYGLLDQILALKWVQKNIAAFGGDPDNVTLSGESAGSACVTALCTSPLAKGLFRRILAESSTVTAPRPAHSFRLLDAALKSGKALKERYGAKTVEDLRKLPAEKIAGELSTQHHITVDGYILTETPYESYLKGVHNEEAQMHGFNREESAPFILFSQASLKNYKNKVQGAFGEYAGRVLELYPASTNAEAKRNWADIYSAVLFNYGHYCLRRQAAACGIPSYEYYFTQDNGRLGTWHSGEEVYFYGNIPEKSGLYSEADRALSRIIVSYICNYMKTGDPNGEGLPEWSADDPKTLLEFGEGTCPTGESGASVCPRLDPYISLYGILDEMYSWKGR